MEETAIEVAAFTLQKKVKKVHTQHSEGNIKEEMKLVPPFKYGPLQTEDGSTNECDCAKTTEEVEAGRHSPILTKKIIPSRTERPSRHGVSQRNPTEGKLLTEALKFLKVQEKLDEWSIVHLRNQRK